MSSKAVVHIIDDDLAVRQSLSFLLTSSGFAVRIHQSADHFIVNLAALQPGCVVSDVRMPGMNGIELQQRLKSLPVSFPLIIMTGHGDVHLAVEAMKAGALDFIEKPFEGDTMISAVRHALAQHDKMEVKDSANADARARLQTLSPRERQVLDGLVAGQGHKEIGRDLHISPRTVEVHRANIMTKMGTKHLPDLVRMAIAADGALDG